jgi:hypothetical protein
MAAKKGNKNALGNEGGRPTKLTPEVIELARNYLQTCKDEQLGMRVKVSLPSIAGLARCLNVSRETIYSWQGAEIEFSDICADVLAEQEKRLTENGLAGTYNPTITKLLLMKHGYTEKTDMTSGGKELQSLIYLPAKPNDGVEA